VGTAAVWVPSSDLPCRVDGIGSGIDTVWDIDERVGAVAVDKTVPMLAAVFIIPGDLTRVVECIGECIDAAGRINCCERVGRQFAPLVEE